MCLSFRRRDIPDGVQKPTVIEPGHSFESGKFHRLPGLPGPPVNDLRLVEAVDDFGQGVVGKIALAVDQALDTGLAQTLCAPNAHIFGIPQSE